MSRCKRLSHSQIQHKLVQRLVDKGTYERIIENLEYCVNGIYGETDVIGVTHGGQYHIYEVKSNSKKYTKATKQMRRHYETHPEMDAKYVFISPKRVQRIPLRTYSPNNNLE